jgi:2-polyprenyl-3-methyl-5-hydroxy-6-metoxy-1,4-benzoquinol methylase
MYRTGYDLDDRVITERYSRITHLINMPRYFYPFVAGRIARVCPRGGSVLDVGCGNGYLLREVAARRPDAALHGVDFSAGLATNASGGREFPIALGSARRLPFAPAAFDVISMTEVLEHLKEPVETLRQVRDALKPGGVLVLSVPNMSSYSPFWRVAEQLPAGPWQKPFLPSEHPAKTFQPIDTAYLYDEIIELFDAAGLRIRAIAGREFFPYVTHGVPGLRRLLRRVHTAYDPIVERVLPVRLAYRLLLECTPGDAA